MTQALSDISAILSGDDIGIKSRTIYLYDIVDSVSMRQVIQEIEAINQQDTKKNVSSR